MLWTTTGHAGDELGTGVESAGDVNGDGIPDVIASAPGGEYASVFSGRDGRVLWTFKAEAKSDDFGRHVSRVGDVDRDGFGSAVAGYSDGQLLEVLSLSRIDPGTSLLVAEPGRPRDGRSREYPWDRLAHEGSSTRSAD